MAQQEQPQKTPRFPIRGVGDFVLFSIGAAGAIWEIFVDQSSNPYIYALIFAMLRLGTSILDKVESYVGKK
jgi:hypothetical protein